MTSVDSWAWTLTTSRRPPHLDAAGVDGPAVEVFGLALDAGCPRRGRKRGQLEGLGEGQLLLGLAQPRPLFALIIHGTAQISFQRQPPGASCFCSTTGFAKHLTMRCTGGR